MKQWQVYLNLLDCRLIRDPKKTPAMAEVSEFDSKNKIFRYRIGDDFGGHPVNPETLERCAIHECLHIRLHPLIEAVQAYGDDSDEVAEKEHEIIIVLENLLYRLSDFLGAMPSAGTTEA